MKDNNFLSWVILAIAVILVFGILSFNRIGGYGGMMSRYSMMGGYGYGAMFFGWITWILVIALIIAAIYWLIKSANAKK